MSQQITTQTEACRLDQLSATEWRVVGYRRLVGEKRKWATYQWSKLLPQEEWAYLNHLVELGEALKVQRREDQHTSALLVKLAKPGPKEAPRAATTAGQLRRRA